MPVIVRLYLEFFKIGLFSVGGGLATVPFLYELGEKTGWYTATDVADMVAIAESTPGSLGVNMSTYTGYQVAGIIGGLVATLGLISPSIVVIIFVAKVLEKFRKSKVVEAAFYGLRPASTALIASAGFSVCVLVFFNTTAGWSLEHLAYIIQWKAVIIAIILWVCTNLIKWTKRLHPVVMIAASAAVGIIFKLGGA